MAHQGVLFLDELAEFKTSVLQTLRQPLESGVITLTRVDGTYEFPARFQLIAATNPCPCGYFGDPSCKYRCSASIVQAYQNRMGGPLIDRIDMRIDVWREKSEELFDSAQGKSSSQLREGVEKAHAFASSRKKNHPNPQKGLRALRDMCCFDKHTEDFFLSLSKTKEMSARSLAKTLLLSRTIADIAESKQVKQEHVAEAFTLRFGGGSQW